MPPFSFESVLVGKTPQRDRLLPNRKIAKGNMPLGMRKGRPTSNSPEDTVSNLSVEDSASSRPLDGMMAEERRTQILQIVRSEGRARVNELANRFSSSAVTIRNDLNELHQRGLVMRSHGGAVLPEKILRESPVYERLKSHAEEKRRIGATAATLIHDGETIILDSGTTTLEIARQIKNKQGLQVITNGVNIAAELLDARDVQTLHCRGHASRRFGLDRWAFGGGDV